MPGNNSRRDFLIKSVAFGTTVGVSSIVNAQLSTEEVEQEYYEWRCYHTQNESKKLVVSNYLENTLIPALGRQGIDRVGVFTHKHNLDDNTIYMLIPYQTLDVFGKVNSLLANDQQYLANAKEYFAVSILDPNFVRIESKLHKAFAGMPQLQAPPQTKNNQKRVFEMRVYQGHTEQKTALKIEQFNTGEIFVMQDVGLNPVFYGELLIGEDGPNMMYMTSAASEASSKACWDKFKVHPEWQRLRNIEKYKDTVSFKTKDVLVPTHYSQI